MKRKSSELRLRCAGTTHYLFKLSQFYSSQMLCFIAIRLVDLYEKESPSHHQPAAKQRKPASSDSRPLVGLPSGEKKKIVSLMNQLAELELCQLWEPPSPQMMEGWSSLLGNLCYKILENSTISRDQSLRDQVIHLLGVLIRDYGQALSEYTPLTPLITPVTSAVSSWQVSV